MNRAAAAADPRLADLPPLIFMTDPARTLQPWRTAARLPPGAAVIHRGFGRPEAADEAARLRAATTGAGVRLLIAADADLADAVGADGLHLPQRDLARADAVRRARPDWLLTGAAHIGADAVPEALDAVLISPVFTAGGASATRPALGIEGFQALAARLGRPALALGGMTARRARELIGRGACGVAAIDAVRDAWGD